MKDNRCDSYYIPSPTVFLFLSSPCLTCAKNDRVQLISFTSGQGLYGYTELSEVYYAKAYVLTKAGNVLPYFAGSGLTLTPSRSPLSGPHCHECRHQQSPH